MAGTLLTCPVWHRPLAGTLRIIEDALSVKCRACGDIHLISRSDLNSAWDAQQKTALEGDHLPQEPVGASA
jgi:hypothetical protein